MEKLMKTLFVVILISCPITLVLYLMTGEPYLSPTQEWTNKITAQWWFGGFMFDFFVVLPLWYIAAKRGRT